MIGRLVLLLAIFAALTAYGTQPCAPQQATYDMFKGTYMGLNHTDLDEFHRSGYRNALDPRVLASVAKGASNGGENGCTSIMNNPFYTAICLDRYPSIFAAIVGESDYVGTHFIADNRTNYVDIVNRYDDQHARLDVVAGRHFAYAFGDRNQPVRYSSSCCGDCNRDKVVQISDMTLAVNVGFCAFVPGCSPPLSACQLADADFDGNVTISDLIRDLTCVFT